MRRAVSLVVGFALVATSCGGGTDVDEAAGSAASTSTTTFLDYPDAITRAYRRLAAEPRPVENSAMPPRHLDEEQFPVSLVDRERIVSGGPPADGIPSIDEPHFAPADEIDFLADDEAVVLLETDGRARVYPVQILIWHEIVNDIVNGVPIAVTYCPLCNSAVAVERTLDGSVLEFGTTGSLYQSALVMYDRQTETLWTHFDGRAVVGTLAGAELPLIPLATVAWTDARAAYPDALVLTRDTGEQKPYGRNRYVGYDQSERPLSGFFGAEIPEPIPPKSRVVGIRSGDAAVAVPLSRLQRERIVTTTVRGAPVVAFWQPGTASPLHKPDIADGDDIGATGVFRPTADGTELRFAIVDGVIVDDQTGSTWSIVGRATSGPLAGTRLEPVEHLDTFWFAWVAHHPQTRLEQ